MKMRVGIAPIFQNYTEFDRWEALEQGEDVGPKPVSDAQIWRDGLTLCDLAEPLGFDAVWTLEHRTTPYIMLPAPLQFLAYMAARTERIALGTFVVVVPWHDPMRLAEEISVLGHMLGPDRVFRLGVGRGLARREYAAMHMSMDESRDRFAEGVEVIRLALANERFSYHGKYWAYDNVSIRPQPLDTRVLDYIYGAWGSPPSVRITAEMGINPLATIVKSYKDIEKEIREYARIRAEVGHPPARKPILQSLLFCRESEAEAAEAAEQYCGEYADSCIRHYEMHGTHFAKTKGYEFYAAQSAEKGDAPLTARSNFAEVLFNDTIYGTPDQCVDKAAAINDLIGPSELVMEITWGSMPGSDAEKSLRLFAEKGLKKLQSIDSKDFEGFEGDADREPVGVR